jgi:DNA-binding protein H-NS
VLAFEDLRMPIDLKALSPKQLAKLIAEAKREKQRKQKRAPLASVRRKLTRLAAAEGYTLMELFGVNAPGASTEKPAASRRGPNAGRKLAPKYRNPDDPGQTWAGRGQHPKWLAALLAKGRKLSDFEI